MADQKPPVPFDPTTAKESDFPPPPPGPPPALQPVNPAAEEAHPDPLSANPTAAGDEETRQQQELLEHWQREHQRKLAGLPPSEEHEVRPPQPPRPSQDIRPQQSEQQQQQQQHQTPIPAYNPADPQFSAHGPTHFPENFQSTTNAAAGPSHVAGAGTGVGVGAVPPAAGHEASPHGSPVADDDEHKTSSWSSRFASLGLKAAAPINQLAHKLGSQSFLPETMPKECDKAAGILQSFCSKCAHLWRSRHMVFTLGTDPVL